MTTIAVIGGGFGRLIAALSYRLICLPDCNAAFHFQLKNQ